MKLTFEYKIIFLAAMLWCIGLFIPPFVASLESTDTNVSSNMYRFYSHICHQYDSRSFHFFGSKLAVCARCSSVYFGFFIGLVIFPLIQSNRNRNSLRLLIVAAIPMLLDVSFDLFTNYSSSLPSRAFTGAFFGMISAFVLFPQVESALTELLNNSKFNKGLRYESET